jgi:hypothetical protein
VSYYAKGGTTQVKLYGLIAEDVAKISPDLAVYNPEGQPETVRYDSINAMLLNEFLKEHKKVEAQQATIAELKSTVAQQQKGMEILTAQLKEQLEMGKPATKWFSISVVHLRTITFAWPGSPDPGHSCGG